MSIRVLLVDDQEMIRMGFKMVLQTQPGIEVVAEADDGDTALEVLATIQADVVLLDVRMPRLNGMAALQTVLSMLIRSFATPIAVALLASGGSTALLLGIGDLALISPYALATRAALLGTGTFADAGVITGTTVAVLLVATCLLTSMLLLATTALLQPESC